MGQVNSLADVETQTQVRLIHEGSGFMVEGTISDLQSTHFALPYPGKWKVFMIAPAQFMTADAIVAPASNLAQVQAAVAVEPILLGEVEADAPAAQMVKCPIECVATPVADIPVHLPITGANKVTSPLLFVTIAFVGLIALWLCRSDAYPPN
jgi:hypothetical protein